MDILNLKKDSVLWLLEQEKDIINNLLNIATQKGIEKRIIFQKIKAIKIIYKDKCVQTYF